VPPDILVEGKIAVEVRCLNQMQEAEAGSSGLEEISIPLARNVNALLR